MIDHIRSHLKARQSSRAPGVSSNKSIKGATPASARPAMHASACSAGQTAVRSRNFDVSVFACNKTCPDIYLLVNLDFLTQIIIIVKTHGFVLLPSMWKTSDTLSVCLAVYLVAVK